MKKILKIIDNALVSIIILVILLQGLSILVPKIMGYEPFAITSESMEPNICKGDLVYIAKVPFNQIKVNDIVTFSDGVNDKTFTHRVVEINDDKGWLYTKGDNNQVNDPSPTAKQFVYGKVVKVLSNVGYIHIFLVSNYGLITVVGLIVIWLIIELFALKRKNENV